MPLTGLPPGTSIALSTDFRKRLQLVVQQAGGRAAGGAKRPRTAQQVHSVLALSFIARHFPKHVNLRRLFATRSCSSERVAAGE